MWLYEYTSTTIQKYGVSNICLHAFISKASINYPKVTNINKIFKYKVLKNMIEYDQRKFNII